MRTRAGYAPATTGRAAGCRDGGQPRLRGRREQRHTRRSGERRGPGDCRRRSYMSILSSRPAGRSDIWPSLLVAVWPGAQQVRRTTLGLGDACHRARQRAGVLRPAQHRADVPGAVEHERRRQAGQAVVVADRAFGVAQDRERPARAWRRTTARPTARRSSRRPPAARGRRRCARSARAPAPPCAHGPHQLAQNVTSVARPCALESRPSASTGGPARCSRGSAGARRPTGPECSEARPKTTSAASAAASAAEISSSRRRLIARRRSAGGEQRHVVRDVGRLEARRVERRALARRR